MIASNGLSAVLTVPELARALRIGRNQAYSMVERGQVPALRIGRSIRVPRQALEALLNGQGPENGIAADQARSAARGGVDGTHRSASS